MAFLLQAAHELRGFVRRHSARYAQRDSHFFLLAGRYFLRLLPSLSSSTEVTSGKSNPSKPCSNSSQATRVAFCVLGFSIIGGAPAIICRARLAASTTYANWLSGAFVCTVINSSPQTMPEVFVPGPGGARWCSAKRLQSPEPRVPRAPRPHSPRKNHNTCLKRRSHRAPWQAAAQFLHRNPARGYATGAPALPSRAAG